MEQFKETFAAFVSAAIALDNAWTGEVEDVIDGTMFQYLYPNQFTASFDEWTHNLFAMSEALQRITDPA
jgi:hypothetical protein